MVAIAILLLLLQDPNQIAASSYADRLCRKLSTHGGVQIIVDSDVRAGTLPGGRIYLTAGLFARAQNEAELAGVMAHEIAHAAARTDCIRFVHGNSQRADDLPKERQADQAAIRMLTKARYDPLAMLAFFSKHRREGINLPVGYSAEDLLLEKLQLEATDHPLQDPIVDTPEFDHVHSLIRP
ncbi:MAG: M48 family metalloprotease [Bryobacteraceae bacterium]|jgi:hypothetical protein